MQETLRYKHTATVEYVGGDRWVFVNTTIIKNR